MTCPGDLLSGLVDGELDHATRERVLSHLLACAPCHAEVDALRALKGRLAWAGAETPLPAADLTARLCALAAPGAEPAVDSHRLRRPSPVTVGPPRRGPGRTGPRTPRRLRRRTVGTLVALGLSAAFALGGQSGSTAPRVPINPGTDQFVADYVDATLEVPVNEPVHAVTADLVVGPRR